MLAAREGSGRQPLPGACSGSFLPRARARAGRAGTGWHAPALPGPLAGLSPDLLLQAQPEEGL